jgi:hypothetical protein
VTVNVAGPAIWFVDATNGSDTTGTGRLSAPFQTLGKAASVDAANDRIFLYSGTYADGLAMTSGEWLVGQATTGFATFDGLMGITPPAGTIARPAVATGSVTVQSTVALGNGSLVEGLGIVTSGATQGLTGSGGLTGVTVTQASVSTASGTAVSLNGVGGTITLRSVSSTGAPSGIALTSTTGTFTVTGDGSGTLNGTGGTIAGSTGDGIALTSAAGVTLRSMNVTGSTANGVNDVSTLTTTASLVVEGSSFQANKATSVRAAASGSSQLTATIKGNVILGGGPTPGAQGIEVSSAGTAQLTYDIDSNKVGTDGVTPSPLSGTGINVLFDNDAGSTGKVHGNVVRNAGAGQAGFGIRVFNAKRALSKVSIFGNTVSNVGVDNGILVLTAGPPGGGRLDAGVTGNTVSVLTGANNAIHVETKNQSAVCARINTNTTSAGGTGFFGIFLKQHNPSDFFLEGLAGPVNTYVAAQNPGAASVSSTGTISTTGIGSCDIPT